MDRVLEISLIIIALMTFVCAVLALDGCKATIPDLAPNQPGWKAPPVTVPIFPPPDPFKQHARIEWSGESRWESREALIERLKSIHTDCTAEILLSVECLKCYRMYDFWTYEDIPHKSVKCECGEWLIRYLHDE